MKNKSASIFFLSEHAKAEMARRQISLGWIEEIMKTPEQIVPGTNRRMVYQSRVVEKGKTYLVRLVVEEWHKPPIIVTL
jgi:hypothetical protein